MTSTPIIAIACGPTVTTWDLAKSAPTQSTSFFDAKSLAFAADGAIGSGAVDSGVRQFEPHGGDIVNALAWNHNGQVIVSCSNSTDPKSNQNVVLTHSTTKSKLESFSNFHTRKDKTPIPSLQSPQSKATASICSEATSISFGGKSAKSRYLCVGDRSGAASVWDMKKISRVRCFKMKFANGHDIMNNSHAGSDSLKPSCAKACMDPSDTHVVALHGDIVPSIPSTLSSSIVRTNRITLELFHLKTGSRMTMLQTKKGAYGGGADCFEFSLSDSNQLLVGARDGSLLLWDCSTSTAQHPKSTNGKSAVVGPVTFLEKRHIDRVTDVAFSPMNKVLAASCSMDGSVGFHDIDSKQTIQTIRPWDDHNPNHRFISRKMAKRGLTSFAFHHDGYTWAVGTEQGLVFTYDLRQTGAGPLCTMDASGDTEDMIRQLQFVQTRPSGSNGSGTASAIKKKISVGEDGAVTVERERTTPFRKEVSKTTYSVQKDLNPAAPAKATAPATAAGSTRSDIRSGPKPSSTRTEKIIKRTTRKVVTSSNQSSGTGGSISSHPPETKTERTSTSEVTTSTDNQPNTTKRIKKTKITTSSPQRLGATSILSPPGSDVAKDLFSKNSTTATSDSKKEGSIFERLGTLSSTKNDTSVSFDERVKTNIPLNDLTYGDNESSPRSDSSDEEAEQMMENFDKMYERIKSRALDSTKRNDSNHTAILEEDIDDDVLGPAEDVVPPSTVTKRQNSKPDDNDEPGIPGMMRIFSDADEEAASAASIPISKVQEMIDDAVESLRDDMEETVQSLQLEFLRQIQKQSDEVESMMERHRRELQRLANENKSLREENHRLFLRLKL